MKLRRQPLYSPIYHIRCYGHAWWLPKSYLAITWWGRLHFRCSREELMRMMYHPRWVTIERHEHVHLLQARSFATRYLGFYLRYLGYWLRNLLRYRSVSRAYREIPFEREAYARECEVHCTESHWRDYR